jgi:hypothetical protein
MPESRVLYGLIRKGDNLPAMLCSFARAIRWNGARLSAWVIFERHQYRGLAAMTDCFFQFVLRNVTRYRLTRKENWRCAHLCTGN